MTLTAEQIEEWRDKVAMQYVGDSRRELKAICDLALQGLRSQAVPQGYALVPLSLLTAVVKGFKYDPGHSDLDNEQPITTWITLGEWRKLDHLLAAASAKESA